MNTFYSLHNFCFFDATTIALMIPSVILVVLLSYVAIKKRYWALNPAYQSISAAGPEQLTVDDGRIAFAFKRLSIYLCCLVVANASAAFFLSTINYGILSGETFRPYFMRELLAMASGLFTSILGSFSLFALVQAVQLRQAPFIPAFSPRNPTRFLFSCMAFLFIALWNVPATQAILVATSCLPGDLYILKDLAKVCIALSAMPLSLMVILIALTCTSISSQRAKQRIHLQSLSPESLAALPEDRLHQIVDDARLAQNVEAAEIVSLHLLERAEASIKSS